jgi:hypothetical protein
MDVGHGKLEAFYGAESVAYCYSYPACAHRLEANEATTHTLWSEQHEAEILKVVSIM